MDNKIKLKVQGITNSQVQSGAYALILAEENGQRRIPIIVGTPEAQSIAIVLEGLKPPRPLTHDLFVTFVQAFGIQLIEVFIYRFEEGIFYSELLFDDGIRSIKIDSRTSDAIAIALRVKCEIYTTAAIVNEAGIVLDEVPDKEDDLFASFIEKSVDESLNDMFDAMENCELEAQLREAIALEDYELAKVIKEELHRREETREE